MGERSPPAPLRDVLPPAPMGERPPPAPLRDVLPRDGARLHVLFVGINPSLRSAEVGHHFARPGNRFWPAIHLAGFTPRRLRPEEDGELAGYGLGVTNIASRPTRAASDLADAELRDGLRRLEELVRRRAPRLVAVLGVTAWRIATGDRHVALGPQAGTLGERPVWVLPNPSGLNAHHQLPDLARLYGEARRAAGLSPPSGATRPTSGATPSGATRRTG